MPSRRRKAWVVLNAAFAITALFLMVVMLVMCSVGVAR